MGAQIGLSTPRCFKSSKARQGRIGIWIRCGNCPKTFQKNGSVQVFANGDESQKSSPNAIKRTKREIDIILPGLQQLKSMKPR